MGNIAGAAAPANGNANHMPTNIYSHSHYQTNNSNNSTKRAIQGMKMHIWANNNTIMKQISEIQQMEMLGS